jgi:hypothetical protein
MRVYLAGPMRGYPKFNFLAFLDAEARLSALGYEVLSPARHDLDLGFDPGVSLDRQPFDLREAMRWDISALLDSQAVVTLDGWQDSLGASAEVAVARAVGMEVVPLSTLLVTGAVA